MRQNGVRWYTTSERFTDDKLILAFPPQEPPCRVRVIIPLRIVRIVE